MSPCQPFWGKYRGQVVNNTDPLQLGRIQVSVPAVLGQGQSSWALPCVPYAGPGVGLFLIPPVGGNVWVEFEGGDPDYPIWSGCFWAQGQVPAAPALAQMKVLKTEGATLTINDLSGGGSCTLEVGPPIVPAPLKLVFDPSGIELSHGAASIKLTPTSVSVNNGALEVI
ncbi:MAG TPA: phage baseplate assembly protein V [Anaerolineae bacterium]|nr:phage baseplate assembly protein V [Anaerolineae bacterium]